MKKGDVVILRVVEKEEDGQKWTTLESIEFKREQLEGEGDAIAAVEWTGGTVRNATGYISDHNGPYHWQFGKERLEVHE